MIVGEDTILPNPQKIQKVKRADDIRPYGRLRCPVGVGAIDDPLHGAFDDPFHGAFDAPLHYPDRPFRKYKIC